MTTRAASSPKLLHRFQDFVLRRDSFNAELAFSIGLDGTLACLVRDTRGNLLHGADPRCITVVNPTYQLPLQYRLAHGAEEFIQALAALSTAKITFISSGKKWRNEELVRNIMLRVEARSSGKRIPYRVVSTSSDKSADNNTVKPTSDLTRSILVDHCSPLPSAQAGHLLKIRHAHTKSEGYFSSGRNDLFFALGMILKAIENAATQKTTIKTALDFLQYTVNVEDCGTASEEAKAFYEAGLQEMRKFNPTLNFQS